MHLPNLYLCSSQASRRREKEPKKRQQNYWFYEKPGFWPLVILKKHAWNCAECHVRRIKFPQKILSTESRNFPRKPLSLENPCLVVSLDVEVGEIDGYSPLGWSNNFPDTVLEAGVLNIPSNRRTSNKLLTNGNTGYKGNATFQTIGRQRHIYGLSHWNG
jgi:hypothetical protein